MITATLGDVRSAFFAFVGIGQAAIPAKAAWRVSRLTSKLKVEILALEDAQKNMAKAANIESSPVREEDETDEAYSARWAAFKASEKEVIAKLDEMIKEKVDIDYDAVPISLFGEAELKPTDLMNAGPFIAD